MILFLLCAVILTLLILIQRGRGGGLAGAFGGAGGSSAFGTKTADVFTKATAVLGAIFIVLAIATALLMRGSASATRPADEAQAPAAPGAGGEGGASSGSTETPATPSGT